ncbi:MFS transporter [Amycolatopsis halotolerans]|uniref:MFS transporter n=1 Tax=Amycolatopsis halotolerans TaxID=330083 RepID=A0ABV7QUQ8_9PSEU
MRTWGPLIAICLGTFLLLTDVTIVTVALPAIAKDLHSGMADLEWAVDIYALALAALLLGVGSSADRFGCRKIYATGLATFAGASLACALSPDIAALIVARGVQGVGAAAMLGTTIALLGTCVEDSERGLAFGVWGATSASAVAVGPIAGGLLTEHGDWRWIFLINLPISVVAAVFVIRYVKETPKKRTGRLDVLGVLAFTVAAGAATWLLIRVHGNSWTSATTLILGAVAVGAFVVFVVVERLHPDPMLDLSLFRSPAFSGIAVAGFFMQAAAFAYLLFTSLWLQSVLKLGPVDAGLVFLPLSLAAFLTAILAGRFGQRSPYLFIGAGLPLIGAGALAQTFLTARSTASAVLPGMIVVGIGVGLATPTMSAAALSAAPADRGGMAGAAVNTFRQLGYAVGIALFGVVFDARVRSAVDRHGLADADTVAAALGSGQAQPLIARAPSLEGVVREAFAAGLDATCLVAAIAGFIGGASVLGLALVRASADPKRPRRVPPCP